MLMKQSKMQFQEIQISSLDNGCPEQLHFQINDIFQSVNFQVFRILVIRAVDGVIKRQQILFIMESQIPRSKLRDI